MNIPETLKTQLLKDFRIENQIKKIILNKEIYRFENYNINQIFKIFEKEQQNLFNDSNSKKHLIKVQDMIKTNFFNSNTSVYLNLFSSPSNNQNELLKRRDAIENLNLNFEEIDEKKLKKIITNLDALKKKVSFNNRILTLDSSSEKILYEKYKLHSELVSKKELEEIVSTDKLDKNMLIVTEEDLYTQIPTYKLKDFEKLIIGNILKTNKNQILLILDLLDEINPIKKNITKTIEKLCDINFNLEFNSTKLKQILNFDYEQDISELTNKVLSLDLEVSIINKEIKEIVSKKQLSLQGDELLELLNSGDTSSLQKKFSDDTKVIIKEKEDELKQFFKDRKINVNYIFSSNNYPLEIDEEIKQELLEKIEQKSQQFEFDIYSQLGEFSFSQINSLVNFVYFFDLIYGIKKFEKKYNLNYVKFADEFKIIEGKNIYIQAPMPINYAVGSIQIENQKLNSERVCILTGANSGGKTTLLEMYLQMQILTCMGLGICANKNSSIKLFNEVVYLKKFSGTQGSGAFEQTIRYLIDIIDTPTQKLILIDEFEAVTEPGAAAKILVMFLSQIVKQKSYTLAASHLGAEIKQFLEDEKIEGIRIDGISAKGLDEKGDLITNHQPQFYKLGKSTPELILKRILQDEKFWKDKSDKSKKVLEGILL